MSKELEALNKIQHDFGQLKGQELVNCYETIFNGLKSLEAIDNANPSEALECVDKILGYFGKAQIETMTLSKCNILTIKQALQRLAEVEKLTNLKFKARRKIADEYIKWCQKNNAVCECATNMITWVLCIKLKEVIK